MQQKKPNSDIEKLNTYVRDARFVHAEWRNEAWRDEEMVDSVQWSDEDYAKAKDAEIDPLTINLIFPVINLIQGHMELNPQDVIAKGRTKEDNELSEVMTEGIKYVLDQSEGRFRLQQAFRDGVVPGFGAQEVTLNPDPRQETLTVVNRDWKDILWDPFGSPWLEPGKCRYTVYQPWVDVDELTALFPSKKKEIEDKFRELSGGSYTADEVGDFYEIFDDAEQVEEYKRSLIGGGWIDQVRRRCRPVEVWHSKFVECLFARFENGMVLEIKDELPEEQQMQMVMQSQEILRARVRKIITTTLLGDLVLQDMWSPFEHDLFPQVPWIGYLDRFKFPYGVPRNLRDQNIEVNKRRSMALALLGSKRVVATSDVGKDNDARQAIFEEAQKVNGFVLVEPSDSGQPLNARIAIEDQSQLAQGELNLMMHSKDEIQQISGANAEQMGQQSNAESGKAIQQRIQQGNTMLAPLFGNARRSMYMLGLRIASGIQQYWTGPKVLRVTDRMSGAEKFVEVNQRAQDQFGNEITMNNVTQGRFDYVISERPAHDTVREANMNMLMESIKKAPPEAVPVLLSMAFEMSNLPNKEQLMLKLKPLLGLDPTDDEKSPEQVKQEAIQRMEQQQKQQAEIAQMERQKLKSEVESGQLEVQKLAAEIKKILSETFENQADAAKTRAEIEQGEKKTEIEEGKLLLDGYKTGLTAGQKQQQGQQQPPARQNQYQQGEER